MLAMRALRVQVCLHRPALQPPAARRRAAGVWRRPAAAAADGARPGGDELLRTLSDNGQVSVLVVDGTRLVAEAVRRHGCAPTAAAALGRALLGTLLLAAFREEGERTQVTFRGDGPLGVLQVIAESDGAVKGLVGNPRAALPLTPGGKLPVGAAVGRGVLAVVRSWPPAQRREPYTGLTAISSGEVAEDLASYLAESEQTRSALALGVSIGRDGGVRAAGGFLVSVLPFAEEATLAALERNIAAVGPVSAALEGGASAAGLAAALLEGLGGAGGPGFSLAPRYGPCEEAALRGRMARAVAALGEDEARGILAEQGCVEMRCEFCAETYRLGADEVEAALAEGREGGSDGSDGGGAA